MKLLLVIACVIIAVNSKQIRSNYKELIDTAIEYMKKIVGELNKIETDFNRSLESKFNLQDIVNKECETQPNLNEERMKNFQSAIMNSYFSDPSDKLVNFPQIKKFIIQNKPKLEAQTNREEDPEFCDVSVVENLIELEKKLLQFILSYATTAKKITESMDLKSIQDYVHEHNNLCVQEYTISTTTDMYHL